MKREINTFPLKGDLVMQHMILVSHPTPNKENEFIGPFDNEEARDVELNRLSKEEHTKTCKMSDRMSQRSISYYRAGLVSSANDAVVDKKIKKAA